jgi:hypothetical protein
VVTRKEERNDNFREGVCVALSDTKIKIRDSILRVYGHDELMKGKCSET